MKQGRLIFDTTYLQRQHKNKSMGMTEVVGHFPLANCVVGKVNKVFILSAENDVSAKNANRTM